MDKHLISVIMPVYNGEKYLHQAITSILNQTYTNFELIIINDGSTDGSEKIMNSIEDHRICCISKTHSGISKSLNLGLEKAKGTLIARMDADDIALPDRFEKQIHAFNKEEKLILCAGSVFYINEEGDYIGRSFSYSRNYSIKKMLQYGNIIFQPTVMAKREAILECGGYNESLLFVGEDYDLWKKLQHKGNFSSIKEPLIYYRITRQAVSTIYYNSQGDNQHFKNRDQQLKENELSYGLRVKTLRLKPDNIAYEKTFKKIKPIVASIIIEIKNILTILK